ncbi:membrane bound O-acyl transferase family-domain-containing protein [Phlebopus sp. FC_14]|nr:membrane bound O-acyl transferase family-domain-containing protein [Phlebopus sp. FC_14]
MVGKLAKAWFSRIKFRRLVDLLIPQRLPVTPFTFATIYVPAVLSYYVMAILVQLPRMQLYRLALLPLVYVFALRAGLSLDFSGSSPSHVYHNQGLALSMVTMALRSTAWTFVREPYIREPIARPQKDANGDRASHSSPDGSANHHPTTIRTAMWNAWDLMVNLRGIGWNWPERLHVPRPMSETQSRLVSFALTVGRLLILVVLFDAITGYVRSFGPDTFGSPLGGNLFDPSLPPFQRYLKAYKITALTGATTYINIEAVYHLHAVMFMILFQQHPSQWPPLFDSPWQSTSLSSFWARRWHQLYRESFVAVGSRPLGMIFGRAGIVMGAFIVSAILHDLGMRGMDRGADSLQIMGFFIMHGVGVVLEYAWGKTTGRRVGGVLGWLWTFTWFMTWGCLMVDSWARRGLMGSEFFPEPYRPTTLLAGLYHGK